MMALLLFLNHKLLFDLVLHKGSATASDKRDSAIVQKVIERSRVQTWIGKTLSNYQKTLVRITDGNGREMRGIALILLHLQPLC